MPDRVLSVVGRAPDASVSVWDLDVDDDALVLSSSAGVGMQATVPLGAAAELLQMLTDGLRALQDGGWTIDNALPLTWRSLQAHPRLAPVFWSQMLAEAEQVLAEDPALEAIAFSLQPTGIRPTFVAEGAEADFARRLHPGMVAHVLECQHAMVRIDRDGLQVAEGEIGDLPSRRTRRRVPAT